MQRRRVFTAPPASPASTHWCPCPWTLVYQANKKSSSLCPASRSEWVVSLVFHMRRTCGAGVDSKKWMSFLKTKQRGSFEVFRLVTLGASCAASLWNFMDKVNGRCVVVVGHKKLMDLNRCARDASGVTRASGTRVCAGPRDRRLSTRCQINDKNSIRDQLSGCFYNICFNVKHCLRPVPRGSFGQCSC